MDLSKYYAEICKTKLLTLEEERDYCIRYKDPSTSEEEKQRIKNAVIKANLRYTFKQARKYSKNDPSTFEDLICEANIGLLIGFDKYDVTTNFRLLTYCDWWIRQRMLDSMSKMRIVALPVWKQQVASKIQKLKDSNENITAEQIAEAFTGTGVSDKDLKDLTDTKYLTYHIDDMSEDEFAINPIETEVHRRIDDEKAVEAVNKLPSPYREVIARCFGLNTPDCKEQTPAKIARELKLPKADIQEYKTKGLEMLRVIMQAKKEE